MATLVASRSAARCQTELSQASVRSVVNLSLSTCQQCQRVSVKGLGGLVLFLKNIKNTGIRHKMLKALNGKSILTLYFSILRPCLILAQTNMSSGNVEAGKYLFYF